jgi:hypothetical protein
MQISYIGWGILFCFVKLHGEIDDALIQKVITSRRNIVNLKDDEIQFCFRGRAYVLQFGAAGGTLREWIIGFDGEKKERRKRIVSKSWPRKFFRYMWKKRITHDIFIDGECIYHGIGDIGDRRHWDIMSTRGLPRKLQGHRVPSYRYLNYWDRIFNGVVLGIGGCALCALFAHYICGF